MLLTPSPYRGPIPIVGYHAIDGPAEFAGGPRYDEHGLNISEATFRSQLEWMYGHGYVPFNARDVVLRHLDVPPGKRPIVLTFDDGRPSQFRYLADGRIDPHCAVGVLLDFHRRHPDWVLRGTFYLIAGSDANGVPFDQEGLERKKVRQLLNWGFEIGNHTLTHPSFRHLSARQIMREVAGGAAYLERLAPGIRVDTLALPYGQMPDDPKLWRLLRRPDNRAVPRGKVENRTAATFAGSLTKAGPRRRSLERHRLRRIRAADDYRNDGVFLFNEGICPSPFTAAFDATRIPRLSPKPGFLERLK